MLLLWLGLLGAAVSPQLHQLLHKDSQNPTHNCVVTQVQQQAFLGTCDRLVVSDPVLTSIGFVPLAETRIFPTTDYRLSPSRAPPSLFSSSTVAG
jgi:hypothetical protein